MAEAYVPARRPPRDRPVALRLAVVTCLAAPGCTDLVGRTRAGDARDGAADALAADASDAAAPPDVRGADAPPCPRRGVVTVARSARFGASAAGTPLTNPSPRGAFLDGAGRVVVVGQCARCGPEDVNAARLAAWRFRWDTLALDAAFGVGGAALDPAPTSRAFSEAFGGFVDRAGRLVLFGHESPVGNNNQALVVRLTAEGAPDPSFGAGGRFVLTRSRLGAARGVVAFGAVYDSRGALLLVNDGGHWAAESQRAWAVRVTDDGELDPAFGASGVVDLSGAVGCFDVALDGDDYVLACVSPSLRPKLLRLDGDGNVAPWAGGARAEADQAPQRFEVRSLNRDASGRWVVAGAAATAYSDASSSAAAVRFSAEGAPDPSFGLGGVAAILGPRSTFAYSFQRLAALTCEDRLLVGGGVGNVAVVSALDGRGGVLEEVGTRGSVPLRDEGTAAVVHAVIRREGTSDVVAVASHGGAAMSLHRLEQ